VGAILLVLACGCAGTGDTTEQSASHEERSAPVPDSPDPARERPAAATVAPSHCPPDLPGCRTAEGQIAYVESVDPDGDGDAHFVIVDPQGITLPGLTAIDVRRGLRPEPLPEVGDLISAAGQVQTGSYGQSQIHAVVLHVAGD